MIVLTDKHNETEHSNKLVTLSTLKVMSDVIGVGNGHLLWPNDHCISEEYMNEPYSLPHKASLFFKIRAACSIVVRERFFQVEYL